MFFVHSTAAKLALAAGMFASMGAINHRRDRRRRYPSLPPQPYGPSALTLATYYKSQPLSPRP